MCGSSLLSPALGANTQMRILRGCVNANEGVSRIYSFGLRQSIRSFVYFGTRHINEFDACEEFWMISTVLLS